jgi:hypothetical protein
VEVTHESTRAGGPEHQCSDPHLLGDPLREAHHAISYHAAHRRRPGRAVQPGQQVPERRGAVPGGGQAERGDVLRDVVVAGRRQAVGNGVEPEAVEARHRAGAAGPDQAPVVVLGVDEGDEEAPRVQHLSELQQGRDVARRGVRDEHGVGARAGAHGCFSSFFCVCGTQVVSLRCSSQIYFTCHEYVWVDCYVDNLKRLVVGEERAGKKNIQVSS